VRRSCSWQQWLTLPACRSSGMAAASAVVIPILIQQAYQEQPAVPLAPRRVESYGDSVRRVERKAEARNTVCYRLGGPGWL
jgi:hypothetical protein